MLNRMLGAAMLKGSTFEDVEHDRSAHFAGDGGSDNGVNRQRHRRPAGGRGGYSSGRGLWSNTRSALMGYLGWRCANRRDHNFEDTRDKLLTGAKWRGGQGLLKLQGLLNILVFIPILGEIVRVVTFFWQLAAMLMAIRESLDYNSLWRAFFVVLIALIPVLIVNGILVWALGI